jgi:hypothetical protein
MNKIVAILETGEYKFLEACWRLANKLRGTRLLWNRV